MPRQFATYEEFFLHYLRQHRDGHNRLLHACGTGLGVAVVIASVLLHHPWFALLFLPVGYGFAWFGHLVLEGNKPATWGNPWWSFVSDFRMLALMLTGRLEEWIRRAEQTEKELAATR
jgi:hypothetical protein